MRIHQIKPTTGCPTSPPPFVPPISKFDGPSTALEIPTVNYKSPVFDTSTDFTNQQDFVVFGFIGGVDVW